MTPPLVSVIVPVYNGETTLPDTVESVLRQTFQNFELIIIDDGSTDGTLRWLRSVRDSRLRVFSYPNGGLSVARNRGIERSRGEFISFIDSDDLWTPDKLELQLQALRQQPQAALAYSWTAFVDQHGRLPFRQGCVVLRRRRVRGAAATLLCGERVQHPRPQELCARGGGLRQRHPGCRGLGVLPASCLSLAIRRRSPLSDSLPDLGARHVRECAEI